MLFQFDIAEVGWVIGLGLMFGLAFILTLMTYKTYITFFIFLTMFNAFVVWANLLELWTLILNIIILTVIIIYQVQTRRL